MKPITGIAAGSLTTAGIASVIVMNAHAETLRQRQLKEHAERKIDRIISALAGHDDPLADAVRNIIYDGRASREDVLKGFNGGGL